MGFVAYPESRPIKGGFFRFQLVRFGASSVLLRPICTVAAFAWPVHAHFITMQKHSKMQVATVT